MSFLWWMLTKDDYKSWILGVPAIMVGLYIKLCTVSGPALKLNFLKIFPFTVFFLKESFLGGLDVIWRAFHPKRPLAPDFIQYQLKIKNTTAQVFFANTVSLLPGTFSANLMSQSIDIHVLDERLPNMDSLHKLESKVAALFCEDIAYD